MKPVVRVIAVAVALGACVGWLARAGEAPAEPDLREVLDTIAGTRPGWAQMMLAEPPTSAEVTAKFDIRPVAYAAFAPGGEQMIVWVRAPYAHLVPSFYDPQTLRNRGAIADERHADQVACSADGTMIAMASSSDFRQPRENPLKVVLLGEDRKLIAIQADPHRSGRGRAMFDAEGRLYAADSVTVELGVQPAPALTVWTLNWEAEGAEKVRTVQFEEELVDFLVSPNGKVLVAMLTKPAEGEEAGEGEEKKSLWVLRAFRLPQIEVIREIAFDGTISDWCFSYDSSLLALLVKLEEDPEVVVLKTADWSEHARIGAYPLGAQPNMTHGGLAISPDNRLLAFFNTTARMVSIVSLPDGEPVKLLWAGKSLERPGGSVAFSPDGKTLVAAGVAVVRFDVSALTGVE